MAKWILAWDDVAERVKRTANDADAVGIPIRSQSVSLTADTSSVSVSFSSSMPSADYSLTCTMQNTTDMDPQLQTVLIVSQDEDGFIASWPAPLSSGNYRLNYQAIAFL